MAKPVNHDLASGAVTTAYETVKWGALGVIGVAAVGAIASVGLLTLATAGAGAILPAITAGEAVVGLFTTGIGLAGMAVAAIAGAATTTTASAGALGSVGLLGAIVGAIGGFFKGTGRVSHEKQLYQDKVAGRAQTAQMKLEAAQQIGAQQGYMQGVQDGQQMVVSKLREMQMASIQNQIAHAEVAQKAACGKCSHAEAELKRRAAQAAAGAQIS